MKKRLFLICTLLLAVLVAVPAAVWVNGSAQEKIPAEGKKDSSVSGSFSVTSTEIVETAEVDEEDDVYCVVSEYTPHYTQNELLQMSSLVVLGTVEEESEPFTIRGVSNIGEQLYTDYRVSVAETVRGITPDSETVVVRLKGNPDDTSVVYEDEPILDVGSEYLFFLQKPDVGGGFNTTGDYYYVIGSRQGVYEKLDTAATLSADLDSVGNETMFMNQEELLINESIDGGVLKVQKRSIGRDIISDSEANILVWGELTQEADSVNASFPVSALSKRQEVEENLKTNWQNGIITEDVYRQALNDLDIYAEIVE